MIQLEFKTPNHILARDDQGTLIGLAQRNDLGFPWTVFKVHFRDGFGEIGGFPGGNLAVGTVEASSPQRLQKKLVVAMLEALAN